MGGLFVGELGMTADLNLAALDSGDVWGNSVVAKRRAKPIHGVIDLARLMK